MNNKQVTFSQLFENEDRKFSYVLEIDGERISSEGIRGDDTDGHIDQLARFVAPGCVVAACQPDKSDPNHESLKANFALLKSVRDARGRLLDVVPID